MDKNLIGTLQNQFNEITNILEESAIEYRFARE